jgi:hypothetical protein
VGKVTLDIICDTAFGYRANALTNPHGALTKAYEALLSLQSQRDFAKLAFLVSIPGLASLINHRTLGPLCAPLFRWIPGLSLVETLIESTHTIREISRDILREKVLESGVAIDDLETKRDVMSLLVKARAGEKHGYQLSDEAMVDQVVRGFDSSTSNPHLRIAANIPRGGTRDHRYWSYMGVPVRYTWLPSP